MQVSGKLFLVIAGIFLFLVFKYQDTELFQSSMEFLFSPLTNPQLALLPDVWLEYRLLIISALIVGTLYLYRPTWSAYLDTIEILRKAPPKAKQPPLTPLQATYLYRQDRNIFATWLIDQCTKGIINLHHTSGVYPWAVSRGGKTLMSGIDRQLIDRLFADEQIVHLKGYVSSPNPSIRDTFQKLRKHLEKSNPRLIEKKINPFSIYLVLACLLIELPFLTASQAAASQHMSGQSLSIFMGVFIVILSAFPAYALSSEVLSLYYGPRAKAIIMISGAAFIGFAGLLMLYVGMIRYFHAAMIYLPVVTSMAILAANAPPLATHREQFAAVIGYKKYLETTKATIDDQDLPWTIGLDVQTDLNCSLSYPSHEIPRWLHTKESQPEKVIRELHVTLDRGIREAIYGEMKSRRRSGTNTMGRSR